MGNFIPNRIRKIIPTHDFYRDDIAQYPADIFVLRKGSLTVIGYLGDFQFFQIFVRLKLV